MISLKTGTQQQKTKAKSNRLPIDPKIFLFPGCFLISTPDVCYNAKDGYTYCWCSSGDLCNGGVGGGSGLVLVTMIMSGIFYNHHFIVGQ